MVSVPTHGRVRGLAEQASGATFSLAHSVPQTPTRTELAPAFLDAVIRVVRRMRASAPQSSSFTQVPQRDVRDASHICPCSVTAQPEARFRFRLVSGAALSGWPQMSPTTGIRFDHDKLTLCTRQSPSGFRSAFFPSKAKKSRSTIRKV